MDPITGLLVLGGAISVQGIGYSSACGLDGITPPANSAAYAPTPCPSAVYRGGAPIRPQGGAEAYRYYWGYAPTPEYVSGTRYYGFYGTMVPEWAGVGPGWAGPYQPNGSASAE